MTRMPLDNRLIRTKEVAALPQLGATQRLTSVRRVQPSSRGKIKVSLTAVTRLSLALEAQIDGSPGPDQLNLSAPNGIVNYNAREIRVTDNVASVTDVARFTGPIFGNMQNDLLKTGTGILELTAINAYLGATLVQEGTLLVNSPGTINTSFLTQVGNGATLGGNGTVGALKVASGGRLAPGSNVTDTAILSTGNVTLDGVGAQFSIQIGGTVAGTTFDQLAVTGNVSLNGGDLVGSLINGFAPLPNDLFFIITNDNSDAVSETFAQGNMVFFGNAPFEIGYTGNLQTLSFTGGNDVVLRFIPEPATASLAAGSVALLLLRRRCV